MMWDVVILVVVVFGMAVYWLVSSLRQRGLLRTLLAMLKGFAAVVTLGYIGATKAVEIHNQLSAQGFGRYDWETEDNPYWQFEGSTDPIEHSLWSYHEPG